MPKKTFLKLETEKRQLITIAFLQEFTNKPYDSASISDVVKQLGIAKGSVYQYFENKLDLFTYLIHECSATKMQYVNEVVRTDFPDFWSYFKALYVHGLDFDQYHPLESHFLHQLIQNQHTPGVKDLFEQMNEMGMRAFEDMVSYEVSLQLFRDDLPISTMGYMLFKAGQSIQEQMIAHGHIHPALSIQKKEPVYLNKKDMLLQVVDEYIALLSQAFNKQ